MKHRIGTDRTDRHQVAPFAGAWIETTEAAEQAQRENVAPFAGAWIETFSGQT